MAPLNGFRHFVVDCLEAIHFTNSADVELQRIKVKMFARTIVVYNVADVMSAQQHVSV